MYAAISVEDSPVYSTRIESANNQEVPEHKKGGIIVFPQGTDSLNPAFRISRPDLIGVHP